MSNSILFENQFFQANLRTVLPMILSFFLALPGFAQTTKEVDLMKTGEPSFPYWNEAAYKEVVYGIEMNTLDASDDKPQVIIHGTKGSSSTIFLDNEPADNFQENRKDYFLISGEEIGNVGIPIALEFIPGGNDGWSFDQVKIDYFVQKGRNFRQESNWKNCVDANDYNKFYNIQHSSGSAWGRLLDAIRIDRIEIEGIGKIDGNGIVDNRGFNQVNQIMYARSSKSLSNGSGSITTVPVSSKFIIVDARSSPTDIPWNSSSTANVSSGEIIKALQREENRRGMSNTLTVGMEVSSEAEASGAGMKVKASMKYSFSNALTVNKSRMSATQNENSRNIQSQYGQTDGQTFLVPRGYVAFFERTVSVDIEKRTVSNLNVIGKDVNPSYQLVATYFTTDPNTGELVKYNYTPSTQTVSYGSKLTAPENERFLIAAKKAWPYFKTTF